MRLDIKSTHERIQIAGGINLSTASVVVSSAEDAIINMDLNGIITSLE